MANRTINSRLRTLQPHELDMVLAWRNHPDVRRVMYTQHEIQPDEHRRWFERASLDPCKHLLVFESEHQALGFVNLTVVDERSQRADWGFYLSPDAPRGSGQDLGRLTLAYTFEYLALHKVCGEALAYNERSIRFHERLGFRQEARLREHHFDGRQYHDVFGFGLLRDDWLEYQGALHVNS